VLRARCCCCCCCCCCLLLLLRSRFCIPLRPRRTQRTALVRGKLDSASVWHCAQSTRLRSLRFWRVLRWRPALRSCLGPADPDSAPSTAYDLFRPGGKVWPKVPRDAGERGRDRRFGSRLESVDRRDSRSKRCHRRSRLSSARGSNHAARLRGRAVSRTPRRSRSRRRKKWNPRRERAGPFHRHWFE